MTRSCVVNLYKSHYYADYGSQTSNERLKSDVFSCLLKTDSDGEAMKSHIRHFHTRAATTPKARSPTMTWRVGGMLSYNVNAERSRCRESIKPQGTVHVKGMAEPNRATNGRRYELYDTIRYDTLNSWQEGELNLAYGSKNEKIRKTKNKYRVAQLKLSGR